MQRNKIFIKIKEEYDNFYKSLLKHGKMPVRDTEVGIWGISAADNVFNFFKKIKLNKYKNFLDLGSGDGKVVLIASLFTKATGIEYDKELHDKAVEIREKLNLSANLIQGDFLDYDWSKYDIIFINPDKGFHKGTEDKLLKELNGKLFVYNFVFEPRFLKKGKKYWFNETPVTVYTKK
jgi:protein-L-isoaspartate O-methyltransferase